MSSRFQDGFRFTKRAPPSLFCNFRMAPKLYTLSLHDALPISRQHHARQCQAVGGRLHGAEVLAERSEEHTSELQSHSDLVCRLLLEKKKWRRSRVVKKTIGKMKSQVGWARPSGGRSRGGRV